MRMCSLLPGLHALCVRRQSGFLLNSLSDRRAIGGVRRRWDHFQRFPQENSQLAGRQSIIGLARSRPEQFTESDRSVAPFSLANSLHSMRVAFELDARVAVQTHTFDGRSDRQAVTPDPRRSEVPGFVK